MASNFRFLEPKRPLPRMILVIPPASCFCAMDGQMLRTVAVLATLVSSLDAFVLPGGFAGVLSGRANLRSMGAAPIIGRVSEPRALRSRLTHFSKTAAMTAATAGEKAPAGQDLELVDVAVIGAGPAGLALSALLGEKGLSVLCTDPAMDKDWIPNYGVWLDEVEPFGMTHLMKKKWPRATVFLGGGDGEKKILPRPYGQLDTMKAKNWFFDRIKATNKVRMEKFSVENLEHSSTETTLSFAEGGGVRARMIVDCTGHAKRFCKFEQGREPGFQAAYGVGAKIKAGTYPYPLDEMLLMDWRDDHIERGTEAAKESEELPTFIYCMPNREDYVFFEETSLIANPPLKFEDLKRRMHARLDKWGVVIEDIDEEEFCLIPMGGQFPVTPQRVVGFGGASVNVHPATGYMFSQSQVLAVNFANGIEEALKAHPDDAEAAAHQVWGKHWNQQRIRQRDFLQFGGEHLEEIGLQELREFFGAFFALPYQQWSEFLSLGLLEPLERLIFGLGMWAGTTNRVRLSLGLRGFLSGPEGWYKLGRSILPVADYDDKNLPTKESRPAFFSRERTPPFPPWKED